MGNHSGGRMVSEILENIHNLSIFDIIGGKIKKELINKIIKIAENHDCCKSEILENGLGKLIGLCPYCYKETNKFIGEICPKCHEEYG